MSDYGLEQATELSREEAGKFIKAYFEKYPGVSKYLEDTREKARREGYVETLRGRRRYIPDIIKVAMIKLYREMADKKLKSKMLLQVRDELVFEVPDGEMETMRKLVSR